ncbi:MAG: hypothetical protein ACE5OP_05120 [Candidatus Glassbacteria bacterium]
MKQQASLLLDHTSPARFYQSGVILSGSSFYTFSFDMKSSEKREMHFGIVHFSADTVILIDHDKIAVGKGWTDYTSTFYTYNQPDSNYFFGFNIEEKEDTVWIDDCMLKEGNRMSLKEEGTG